MDNKESALQITLKALEGGHIAFPEMDTRTENEVTVANEVRANQIVSFYREVLARLDG